MTTRIRDLEQANLKFQHDLIELEMLRGEHLHSTEHVEKVVEDLVDRLTKLEDRSKDTDTSI